MELLRKHLYHKDSQSRHKVTQRKKLQENESSLSVGAQFIGRGMLSFTLLLIIPFLLFAQNYNQTINRTAQFNQADNPANELKIYNLHGDISIEGYDGNEIQITAEQQINGTDQQIKQAREELELVVDEQGSTVFVYIDAPFIDVKRDGMEFHYRVDRDDDSYEFLHNITVRVPRNSHIYASTINKGKVSIKNTSRRIKASNVNGKIELTGIAGPTNARTVNGDITIRYAKSPAENSRYQTVNGTINVNYPDDLSADIEFKSLNGELYTNFNNVKRMQAQVKTDRTGKTGNVRYRVDKFTPIRIGNGGPTFSFEVLNGNVYIKRIQS